MTVIYIIILLFSVILHEVAHGYAAVAQGDDTPDRMGRLTLNPIPHLDMVGSIIVPLFLALSGTGLMFGWAKPVQFNVYNLKNRRFGPALVAIAGPVTNFILALVFGVLIRFAPQLGLSGTTLSIFSAIVLINLVLGLFNLIPVPPLDGHHILFGLLGNRALGLQRWLKQYAIFALLFVLLFFWRVIEPAVLWLFQLITGVPLVL